MAVVRAVTAVSSCRSSGGFVATSLGVCWLWWRMTILAVGGCALSLWLLLELLLLILWREIAERRKRQLKSETKESEGTKGKSEGSKGSM